MLRASGLNGLSRLTKLLTLSARPRGASLLSLLANASSEISLVQFELRLVAEAGQRRGGSVLARVSCGR